MLNLILFNEFTYLQYSIPVAIEDLRNMHNKKGENRISRPTPFFAELSTDSMDGTPQQSLRPP